MGGVVVVDKPEGSTSTAVVNWVKRCLGAKRAGHTGTLDPFATGVLPVCVGLATRVIPYLDEHFKEYRAELRLGADTDTLDSTGEVVRETPAAVVEHITEEAVRRALDAFTGGIEQTPPMYSAIKKDGRRMYDLAREGIEVERAKRRITVEELRLTEYSPPVIEFFVRCSRGTYVRSLGVDIAHSLGCAGHLSALRRMRSGSFDLSGASTMDEIKRGEHSLLTISEALSHLRRVEVEEPAAELIKMGRQIEKRMISTSGLRDFPKGERFVVLNGARVVSIVEAAVSSQELGSLEEGSIVFKLLRVLKNCA